MITGRNYLGSKLSAENAKTYKTFDSKANKKNIINFHEATQKEINNAVLLATTAFEEYKNISGMKKAEFLNAIADEIMLLDVELIEMFTAETALPEGRAIGERGRTVGQLRMFAELVSQGNWVDATIDTAIPDRTPIPKSDVRKMMVPLGPVVVFGASNFPLAYSTAGGDTASALAAGCSVIVKSHPMHAGTGELIASAIIKAAEKTGMPNGVFSNLNSSGIEVGVSLVKHPGVKAIGFTGSIKGGRALFDLAAHRDEPIPVFAEMGSINPVVILPKALADKNREWAKIYAGSITLGAGQFCTNPGLLLGIKGDALTQFITDLSTEIEKIDPMCMLHPNIYNAYIENKEKAMTQPHVVTIANSDTEASENFAKQAVTTVSGETFLKNTALHQEVFGPYSIVVQCESAQELEIIISKLEGQLTGTIIAKDNDAERFSEIINALKNRVGRIIYNGVPTGVEVCPSMQHGGPYPASSDSRFSAVGIHAIKRWIRPFSYQDWPNALLPLELQNENPLQLSRLVNGVQTKKSI
jgi:alpha-ketoglutaric semialdehyde dehydrogenase